MKTFLATLLTAALIVWVMWTVLHLPHGHPEHPGTAGEVPPAAVPTAADGLHPVVIRQPHAAGGMLTDMKTVSGEPIVARCDTCHATRPAQPRDNTQGMAFHVGLNVAHGGLSCQSCHAAPGYSALGLADGRAVPMDDPMTLCAQCHGPQTRDWKNGSHGGMSGYWDRTRGPRTRNGCTACHDPHAPAFKPVQPAPPPVDTATPPGEHHE